MSDKEAILQSMENEFAGLGEAVKGLDETQLTRPWLDGWSVKDILAHVLGWERIETMFLSRMARGERPNQEGDDHYTNSDEWNARFASDMAAINPQTVLAIGRQVHMNHARAARSLPEERFAEGKTARRLVEDGGTKHFQEHAAQIREWREREGL